MAATLKAVVQALIYGGLILGSGAMMLLAKADIVLLERIQLEVSSAITPVVEVLGRPIATISDATDTLRTWIGIVEENERLRRENEQLKQWQAIAARLDEENSDLRQLLNFVPDPKTTMIAARVVADPSGSFARSLLVDAGQSMGVEDGQVVLTGEGLVGRIFGSTPRIARVLLLTDLNSRVPVEVGESHLRGILAGDNSDRPKIIHLEPGALPAIGDVVVTSGVTGAFPSGIPVGKVIAVETSRVAVVPIVNLHRAEFVRIMDYGLVRSADIRKLAHPPELGFHTRPVDPAPKVAQTE